MTTRVQFGEEVMEVGDKYKQIMRFFIEAEVIDPNVNLKPVFVHSCRLKSLLCPRKCT